MERNISLSLLVPRIGRKHNRSTTAPMATRASIDTTKKYIGIETGQEKDGCRDIGTNHEKFAVREVDDFHDPEDQVEPGGKQDVDTAGIQPPENDL